MNETAPKKDLTFRRFKSGESMWDWPDLTAKIFQQDKSYKCPTYVHRAPPCQGSCPSGHDIRGWLAIARGMDKPPVAGQAWQEYAFHRMVEANPFPASMGRVCPAPCEDGCNRNEVDDFVGINGVEQYVGDWAIEHKLALPAPAPLSGKKVAVIGGGPAGLAAAWFLRSKGHAVTIFEAHDHLGGMMRYGIPGYRTPRDMLDAEISRITSLDGVTVRTGRAGRLRREDGGSGARLRRDLLGDRRAEGPPAAGPRRRRGQLHHRRRVPRRLQPGLGALDRQEHRGRRRRRHLDRRRVGGAPHRPYQRPSRARHSDARPRPGYTAHDVGGALAREGVKATLTSLFPIEKMTAAEREREDAKREGIDIQGGVMPLEVVLGPDGSAVGLKMCQCTMKGMVPQPIEGTEFTLECDMIISAIGQMADLADGLEKLDNGRGAIAIDNVYRVKGTTKHFAGGDAIRPHLLTTAIGHGRIASETIDHFLGGALEEKRPKVDVHQFNLLDELHHRNLDPAPYDHTQSRGTSAGKYAVHNFEDRGATQIIPHKALVQRPFHLCRPQQARRAPCRRRACAGRFRRAHRRVQRGAGAGRKASAACPAACASNATIA